MSGRFDTHAPLRILVVEDNDLVAETISEALLDSGYEVVGPAPSLGDGLELARHAELDGAILDVDLGGQFSFPIAFILRDRRVPFLFLTGYDDPTIMPTDWRTTRRLVKPFRIADLTDIVAAVVGDPATASS